MKQANEYEDDDGRVICEMDLVGKPGRFSKAQQRVTPPPIQPQGVIMTRAETWRYAWYSVLAGLLIVAVFAATWILFTLFCTLVWFR